MDKICGNELNLILLGYFIIRLAVDLVSVGISLGKTDKRDVRQHDTE